MVWTLLAVMVCLTLSPVVSGFAWGLLERRHSLYVSLRPVARLSGPVRPAEDLVWPTPRPLLGRPARIALTSDDRRERYVQLWLYAQAPPLAAARHVLLEEV